MKTIYTDGACKPNPGTGGWAFTDLNEIQDLGAEKNTTNNRMELKAVIEAVKFCKKKEILKIKIISDSLLVINCAKGIWRKKANLDQWVEYLESSKGMPIEFEWVKGHASNRGNIEADRLANEAISLIDYFKK